MITLTEEQWTELKATLFVNVVLATSPEDKAFSDRMLRKMLQWEEQQQPQPRPDDAVMGGKRDE